MAQNTFRINGRVIDRKTRQGGGGLRVEAWDKDMIFDDLVGSAITDAQGNFRIEFDPSYFKELFLDRQPDLFFKVFRNDELIKSTEDDVLWNVEAGETAIVIEVDTPVVIKPEDAPLVVRGRVTLADGSPFAGGVVCAFDQDLRTRQSLGEAHTDGNGAYRIEYSRKQFSRAEKGGADLVVETSSVGEELLVASEVLFNAPPVATVNLTVPLAKIRVPSEFERLSASIAPLLEGARVLVPDLNNEDIAFIASETGIAREHVDFLVKAARIERETRVDHRVFYACSRKGLPADLHALLDVPAKQRAAAVDAAIAENLVPPLAAGEQKAALSALETLHEERQIEQTLDKPLPGRQLKVRQVLEVAGLEAESQRVLAGALAGKDLRSPNLWPVLQADTGLSASVLERVRFTLHTAELVDDHLATITALHRDELVRSVRDLAKHYDPETWHTLITRTAREDGSDLPADISGATLAERRASFARRIYTRVATAYPTVAMAYGLSRKPELAETHAAQWLPRIVDAHEGFDLATARLDAFVREQAANLGIPETDAEAVREGLKRVQRLYRLKPELAVVSRLLQDKLDSSAAILHQGKAQFVANYGKDDAMGRETAVAIYHQAEVVATKAFGLYAHFSPAINTLRGPAVLGECPAELKGVPNYTTLFGSLDGCECEPCESVYSPAAYLTDLLAFLERGVERNPDANQSVVPANGLEALQARSFCDRSNHLVSKRFRRPDILDMKLSCRNAETLLPYVDLVLEILENAVPPNGAGHSLQTGLTGEQLAAEPEHLRKEAYTTLAAAIFPFSLPFDLCHEEETIYLEKLGTSRTELLETFFPYVSGDPHDLTEMRRGKDKRIAAAHLGLTDLEWELISGCALPHTGPVAPAPQHARFVSDAWGFPSSLGAGWWQPLQVADKLMERSGLSYEDLLRLLALRSFNPQGNIAINSGDAGKCDPKEIRLSGLDETALEFLHRFLRLQRALGWSLQELDQALMGLAPPNAAGDRPAMDEGLLVRLSHLIRLRKKFNLPVVEALAWWAKLDTADYSVPQLAHQPPYRSPYEILFQPGSPGNAQYEAFKLNAARTELNDTSIALSEQLLAISGALRVSQPDLVLMIGHTISDTDPKVNLANLSILYRHASLARALGLTMGDYLTLKTLLNFEPFNSTTLHFPPPSPPIPPQADEYLDATLQTLRFVERVEFAKASDFSIAELDYLLRQTMPFEDKTVAPNDKWVGESLKKLRESQAPLSVLAAPLALLKQALDRLGATPPPTVDELRPLIAETLALVNPQGGVEDNELRTVLQDALMLAPPGASLQSIALSQKLTSAREKFSAIRNRVLVQALATALAEVLGLSVPVCEVLLKQVSLPADPAIVAGAAFLKAFDLPATAPETQRLPELLRRLHKAALVIAKLGITHMELPRFMTMSRNIGWLELATLPVRGADQTVTPPRADPAASFDAWARSIKLFKFRDALPDDQQEHLFSLFDIAEQFSPGLTPNATAERLDYKTKLKSFTHWNEADLDALLGLFDVGVPSNGSGGGMLRPVFPEHFRDERLPVRLTAVFHLLKRIGITAFEAEGWISSARDQAQPTARVQRIRNALKARCGDGWPEVVKPLRDPLREQQRQALVAYLLHEHEWNLAEPADLYEHFLIDVEMSPCMMTSRLIQATASVQLFVQRVLMNLEPGLALSEDGAEQWDWMKNYRVWEANRKIFLYPENWIEPELRDDKTPYFKELENELRQADITNETAETALRNYIDKLDAIANLQVCGMYVEPAPLDAPGILHVLARTRSTPHMYFYRKRDPDRTWTVWERLDAELEGDQLIPVYFNRRLYVFWPILMEKEEMPFDDFESKLVKGVGTLLQSFSEAMFSAIGLGQLALSAVKEAMTKAVERIVKDTLGSAFAAIPGFKDFEVDIPHWDENAKRTTNEYHKEFMRDVPRYAADILIGEIKLAFEILPGIKDGNHSLTDQELQQRIEEKLKGIADSAKNIVAKIAKEAEGILPAKRWEIQLAWIEHRNGTWSAKKISPQSLRYRDVRGFFLNKKRMFCFKGAVRDADPVRFNLGDSGNEIARELQVECYWQAPSFPEEVLRTLPQVLRTLPQELVTDVRMASLSGDPLQIGAFVLNERTNSLDARPAPKPEVNPLSELSQMLGDAADSVVSQLRALTEGEPVSSFDDGQSPIRKLLEGDSANDAWMQAPTPAVPSDSDAFKLLPSPAGLNIRLLASHQFFEAHRLPTNLNTPLSDRGPYSFPISEWPPFILSSCQRQFTVEPGEILPKPGWGEIPANYPTSGPTPLGLLLFKPFYHPFTSDLRSALTRKGIPGIYRPELQSAERKIVDEYRVNNQASRIDWAGFPVESFDFGNEGAYAQYNWEIFFHIPLLIASRLSTNQKFREAQHWFHYIFNPTDASRGSAPEKYWRTKPFAEASAENYERQEIDQLMQVLNAEAGTPDLQETERAVRKWRRDAFNPHLVARTRTTAFQKTVVMKYIDNLIAWGDSLFYRETREAVNEATQLYLLAAKLLGPRPRCIPRSSRRTERSFNELKELRSGLDAFSNALVEFENYLPATGSALGVGDIFPGMVLVADGGRLDRAAMAPVDNAWRSLLTSPSLRDVTGKQAGVKSLYFCVPPNAELLEYWDRVADRLFKIRHCRNIEGRALQLALLAPPIDPAILVRAKAMGVDLDSVLNDLYAPLPHYRFQVLAQKATELCGEVKSLGAALLSALEKRDGEALALLRNTQETRLLEAVQAIKEHQITEAKRGLEGLKHSQEATTLRRDHNQRLLTEFMNPEEIVHTALGAASLMLQVSQFGVTLGASAASLLPNIKAGFLTTLGTTYGGENVKGASENTAQAIGLLSSILSSTGSLVSTMGGYRRRAEDWLLQIALANKELEGLEKQIAAAEIRVAIAESDLANHKLQIRHSKETNDFMQKKFTNQELYDWMVSQISTLYFQTYQLACDLAKKCERAFAHELGVDNPGLIHPGYWGNLKKGLLAGEQLNHDLKRLEVAYLDQNKRELELTRHVSLRQLDPIALLTLKATGTCRVTIPEWLFDLDCPGHYMRRIKSVAISIPSVVGPYTSVNCTLSLLKSSLRKSPLLKGDKYARQIPEDDRFVDYIGAVQSIVTSSGQNDSGMFETNLRDERFLPFEGAGAESTWKLDLPKDYRAFDYGTIPDVILHIRYTARQGVEPAKVETALGELFKQANNSGFALIFNLRHDFPTEWSAFVNSTNDFKATIRRDYFSCFTQGKHISITGYELYGQDVTKPHVVGNQDDWTDATDNLGNQTKQAFSLTIPPDTPGPAQVLARTAGTDVFLVVCYSLA